MSRNNATTSSDHFDLLPFVAILMCTLGCLLFITLSVVSLTKPGTVIKINRGKQKKQPVLIFWSERVTAIQNGSQEKIIRWDDATWHKMETESLPNAASPAIPLELQNTLAEIGRHSDTSFAFFAVRPSGFKSFETMRRLCKQLHLDIGFYPVDETGKVTVMYNSPGETK